MADDKQLHDRLTAQGRILVESPAGDVKEALDLDRVRARYEADGWKVIFPKPKAAKRSPAPKPAAEDEE